MKRGFNMKNDDITLANLILLIAVITILLMYGFWIEETKKDVNDIKGLLIETVFSGKNVRTINSNGENRIVCRTFGKKNF